MIEPLFGPASTNWPGIPSPILGWLPTAPPLGARTTGAPAGVTTPPPFAQTQNPQNFGIGIAPVHGLAIGNSLPPEFYAQGLLINSLAFAGSPIVTAPALLTAVAMKRGQPSGPTNDQELEDFLYDAFELLTGTNEVEVRCEGGRITLTGSVPHRRLKRDIGEIAWAIPTINDVQNNLSIATRRRGRSSNREVEQHSGAASRKQA